MKTLFIDTHDKDLIIAIENENKIIKSIKEGITSHSEVTIPTIKELLEENQCLNHLY